MTEDKDKVITKMLSEMEKLQAQVDELKKMADLKKKDDESSDESSESSEYSSDDTSSESTDEDSSESEESSKDSGDDSWEKIDDQTVINLKSKILSQESKILAQESVIQVLEATNGDQLTEYNNLKSILIKRKKDIEDLQSMCQEKDTELLKLVAKLQTQRDEAKEMEEKIEKQRVEIKSLQKIIEIREEQIEKQEIEINNLKKNLIVREKDLDSQKAEIKTLKASQEYQKKTIEDQQSVFKSLKETVEKQEAEVNSLKVDSQPARQTPKGLQLTPTDTVFQTLPSSIDGNMYQDVPAYLQGKFQKSVLKNGKALFYDRELTLRCWTEDAELFSDNGTLYLRKRISPDVYQTMEILLQDVVDYCFLGKKYLCCISSEQYHLYDVHTGKKQEHRIYSMGSIEQLKSVVALSEDEFLIMGNRQEESDIWHYDLTRGKYSIAVYRFKQRIKKMVLSPDKKKIALVSYGTASGPLNQIQVFEIAKLKNSRSGDILNTFDNNAYSVKEHETYFTPDGSHLIIVPAHNKFIMWNYSENYAKEYGNKSYYRVHFIDGEHMIATYYESKYEVYKYGESASPHAPLR